jgi:hypothetical protein
MKNETVRNFLLAFYVPALYDATILTTGYAISFKDIGQIYPSRVLADVDGRDRLLRDHFRRRQPVREDIKVP